MNHFAKILITNTFLIFAFPLNGLAKDEPNNDLSQVSWGRACFDDWASPIGSRGFFSSNSKKYYHLAQLPWPKGVQPTGTMQRKYGFYQIDIKSSRAKLLFSLNLPKTSAIMPQEDPFNGILAVVFDDSLNSCLVGKSRLIGIPLLHKSEDKKKLKVISERADLRILQGPGFQVAYDLKRQSILEFDFQKFQTRANLLTLDSSEAPLFSDPSRGRYYVWRRKQEALPPALIAYESQGKIAGQLDFQADDKLLQQLNFFGALQIFEQSNSLKIIELGRWSGTKGTKAFKIHVPSDIPVARSQVKVNFSKAIVSIKKANISGREYGNILYLFDYHKAWQIGKKQAATGEFLDDEMISPDGRYLVVSNRDKHSKDTLAFSFFSVSDRNWIRISLARDS